MKLIVRSGGMEEGWTVDLAISKLEVGVGVGWRRVGGLNQRHVRKKKTCVGSEEETHWDRGADGVGGAVKVRVVIWGRGLGRKYQGGEQRETHLPIRT